jgi:hypothetical protein
MNQQKNPLAGVRSFKPIGSIRSSERSKSIKGEKVLENPLSVTTFSHFHQALLLAGTLLSPS